MRDEPEEHSRLSDSSRLDVLQRLGLLDGPAQPSFDRLTRLATQLTGAPVALAVLVDEDRQFFLSQVGLGEPWASRRETPLSHSFCQHVVAQDAPLIVTDARSDELLKTNLAIRDLAVVAYAGVPLVCDGETLGSFCLIDSERREWTESEVQLLEDLADAAMTEMSLRLATAELESSMQSVADSEQRHRSVLAAMTEGVVVMRDDGTITTCNAAAERMLDMPADQMTGGTAEDSAWDSVDVDGSPFPEDMHPVLHTLRTGEFTRGVVMGLHGPEGALTWISVATDPLEARDDSRPRAVLATFRDITLEREAELASRRHTREQEALREVATLVATEVDPQAVFGAAAEQVANVLEADFGAIARLEPSGEARVVGSWSAASLPAPAIGLLLDPSEPSAVASTLKTGEVTRIDRYSRPLDSPGVPVRSGIAAPITVDGSLWGTVSIGWIREAAADPLAGERIARFADLVTLAVTGADAREQLSRLASMDQLTGLHNQRSFFQRLEEEFQRSQRHERPLSLIVLDLDHFKLVNDTHGHQAGNQALAECARRLIEIRRAGDLIARVGGEEFAWILPETDGAAALRAAERARLAIGGNPFVGIGRLTISVGICSVNDASDASDLYRHADTALYWAKSGGRDTTFRYTPEAVVRPSSGDESRRLEAAKTLAAVRVLANAIDSKDPSTRRHSERVAQLATELATAVGWERAEVVHLQEAGLLHDVGKIGLPDSILLKPGRLTDVEYQAVKAHATLGSEILADLLTREQGRWVRHHHERYDGCGYPDGLAAEDIPEGARILAVAEAWDAMTVARPYGAPLSFTDAIEEIRRESGGQFCPEVSEALLALHEAGTLSEAAVSA